MTCSICNGARRIPWPEAGMMQDCECVRVARSLDAARKVAELCKAALRIAGIDAADPWALPEGLCWRETRTFGWVIDAAAGAKSLAIYYGQPGGSLTARPDALALIDLLRRRNEEP